MDEQSFGWTADPEAGKIIERYRGSGRPLIQSDPRVDVLIDVGILLGPSIPEVYYEQDKILISRAVSEFYTQYTIHVDDGLVFCAVYTETLEFSEFLFGPWVHRLAVLAKSIHRGRKALTKVT
jgi:hypothetical protein